MKPSGWTILPAFLAGVVITGALAAPAAADQPFDDPAWRRCMTWVLDGVGGALIANPCIDAYDLPAASIVQCAKQVRGGFASAIQREICGLIFDDYARRARSGFLVDPR